MEILLGIIIGLFTIAGIVVLVNSNKERKKNNPTQEEVSIPVSNCCGAHEVCEFDLLKNDESRIEYYEDEELDEYKNVNENGYTNTQIDQFREVLYTLKTEEIKYWLLSIERRKINLPAILKSEARNLMAEG